VNRDQAEKKKEKVPRAANRPDNIGTQKNCRQEPREVDQAYARGKGEPSNAKRKKKGTNTSAQNVGNQKNSKRTVQKGKVEFLKSRSQKRKV